MFLVFALACEGTEPPLEPIGTPTASAARGLVTQGFVQACTPEPGCAADPAALDPAWCTERSEPFRPTVVDGDLVAVDVDPAVGASIGLAAGAWWSAWRTTDGTCHAMVVAMTVAP